MSKKNFAANLEDTQSPVDDYGADSVYGLPIVRKAQSLGLMKNGVIEIRGCQMTPTGLMIPENTSKEDLEFVAGVIHQFEGSLQWMIGDIVAFSEDLEHGDIDRLAKLFEKSAGTLYNWGSVCRAFRQTSRRREVLSFKHHTEVASLQDADFWLEQAIQNKWSATKLRKEIGKANGVEDTSPALPHSIGRIQKEMNTSLKVWKKLKGSERQWVINHLEMALKELKGEG